MKLQTGKTVSSALLCAACAVYFAAPNASATPFTGDGDGTSFNDAANWSGGAIPQDGASSEIGVGAGLNPAVVSLDATPPITGSDQSDLVIGQGDGGDGTLNHTAGELKTGNGNWSFIGTNGAPGNPAVGRYNLSGTATFTQQGFSFLFIGSGGGAGGPNQGFVTVADDAVMNLSGPVVGNDNDNTGQFDQSGGDVNVANFLNIGGGGNAVGEYNMTGGSLSITEEFSIGENDNASGTFNISGASEVTSSSARARVGRGGSGAPNGALNVSGSGATIEFGSLAVGGNDNSTTDLFATGAQGSLSFTSDAGGVSPIGVVDDVLLNDGSGGGGSSLMVDLESVPVLDPVVLLIDVGGSLTGEFVGLPEGAVVPGADGRRITYTYGDGNNVALVPIPEPASAVLLLTMAAGLVARRRS